MKFKVAAIFQQGPNHFVKMTPQDLATGDLLMGFDSKGVKLETHPPTFEMGRGNQGEHAPKPMIREGEHFLKLTTADGQVFEQGKDYALSFSPA